MIVSRTPLRVSFAGGGTDLGAFYREDLGAVLSTTIRRYVHVTVHDRFEPTLRVAHTRTEVVSRLDALENELVRECLRSAEIFDVPQRYIGGSGLDVMTSSDVPVGSGLGGSSALAVGLLNAAMAHRGRALAPPMLAARACDVEIDRLKSPIGKQDQYAAAFGGLNCIRFMGDETVEVEPLHCTKDTLDELERHVVMVFVRRRGDARQVLERQARGTDGKRSVLVAMRDLAFEMRSVLLGRYDAREFGRLLHDGWSLKRSLGFDISDPELDARYDAARRAGAWGGKLLGAGGGGFMLFFAPPSLHGEIRTALGEPPALDFALEPRGSRIVFRDP